MTKKTWTADRAVDWGTTAFVAASVFFVALAGVVLSYEALRDLAAKSGAVTPWLTWLWPLMLDALAVAASGKVVWAEIRGRRDGFAWGLVIAFTALSVVFNGLHAGLDAILAYHPAARLVVAALVGVLPPTGAALALHLLATLLREVLERTRLVGVLSQLDERIAARRNELAALDAAAQARQDDTRAELAALQAEIKTAQARLAALQEQSKAAVPTGIRPDQQTKGQREAAKREADAQRKSTAQARRNDLLALLAEQGDVGRKQMAEAFGVTPDTIRNDLKVLAADGRAHKNGNGWEVSNG